MKLNNILFTLAAFAGVATAQAVPELQITINSTDGSATYNATGTQVGSAGQVSYSIFDASGATVYLTATETGSVGGSAGYPTLDIDSVDTSFQAGVTGSITIALSDTDFGPTNAGVVTDLSGSSGAPGTLVSLANYYSTSNALFAETNLITSYGPAALTGSNVSQTGSIASGSSNYSLTEVLTIAGSGTGTVSIDARVTTVPDGATTALLVGAGLLGLGVVASRRKLTVA
jgi:hypothetical protein